MKLKKVNRHPKYRWHLIRHLLWSFFLHFKIKTTLIKAKILKWLADWIIIIMKKIKGLYLLKLSDKKGLEDIDQRTLINLNRKLFRIFCDRWLIQLAIKWISQSKHIIKYNSGFTSIRRLYKRKGDGAILTLVYLL